jgi:protein disulfide-isomerase
VRVDRKLTVERVCLPAAQLSRPATFLICRVFLKVYQDGGVFVKLLLVCVLVLGCLTWSQAEEVGLWITDFEAAKAASAERGIPILVDFTGSDWCGWCIRLKKEVFSEDAFITYARANLVMLELDFPMRFKLPDALREQNETLRERYRIRGFPTILLLDAEGKELARTGYKSGGPEAYIAHLKELLAGAQKEHAGGEKTEAEVPSPEDEH